MDSTKRDDLVELIAQAVVDKLEERERINRLADLVVERVLALQEEEALLKDKEARLKEKGLHCDGMAAETK